MSFPSTIILFRKPRSEFAERKFLPAPVRHGNRRKPGDHRARGNGFNKARPCADPRALPHGQVPRGLDAAAHFDEILDDRSASESALGRHIDGISERTVVRNLYK